MDDGRCAQLVEDFSAAWNAGNIEALMGMMALECEFRASVGPEPGTVYVGRNEVQRAFERYLLPSDAPQAKTEVLPLMAGRDFAVTRWITRPDGAPEIHGCDLFVLDGDQIKLKDTYRKVMG